MKFEKQSIAVETWMQSGYYRKSADSEARKSFGATQYMNGGAHYRRSLDGIMEARMVEGVQKDAT